MGRKPIVHSALTTDQLVDHYASKSVRLRKKARELLAGRELTNEQLRRIIAGSPLLTIRNEAARQLLARKTATVEQLRDAAAHVGHELRARALNAYLTARPTSRA